MEKKIVLVTGSSGFIGTNLTEKLLESGFAVIALDRAKPRRQYPGYRCADGPGVGDKDFDLLTVTGDIRDERLLQEVFRYEIRYVVHLAALSTIQMGALDYRETMSINVDGTESLLKAAKAGGSLHGFLYASTDKVYGRLFSHAYTETDRIAPLKSPYDLSKAAADRLVRKWAKNYGFPGIVLRFCNVYGKYDLLATRIIPATIQAVLEKRACVLKVYRDQDGRIQNFRRDFLYVGDLCKAIGSVIGRLEEKSSGAVCGSAVCGEAYNLGTGCDYPIDGVIHMIQQLAGGENGLRIELADAETEISRQCMDCSKLYEVFGYIPETPLQRGLQDTVDWWMQRSV